MAKLINVCSASRSGSSLVDVIIGNSPKGFSCGEVYAWFRPYRTHHFAINCPCGATPCPIWEKIKNVKESQFHSYTIKALELDYIVDSSKDFSWILDNNKWAASQNLEVFNILLWREPIGLAHSAWRRGRDIGDWRNEFVDYYTKIIRSQLPMICFSYDTLIENPSDAMINLFPKIGLKWIYGQENFWIKQHHQLFGSASITAATRNMSSILEAPIFSDAFLKEWNFYLSNRMHTDTKLKLLLDTLRSSPFEAVNAVDTFHPYTRYQLKKMEIKRKLWHYKKRLFPDKLPRRTFRN